MQLLKEFGWYMLGNILCVCIFAVFLTCSIAVHWLSEKFEAPLSVVIVCRGIELFILCCSTICACAFIYKNTRDFIRVLFDI